MTAQMVLVIRRDDLFSSTLRESGCNAINLELIRTEPVDNLSELDKRLARIDDYDGIFLTSPLAAGIFVERLREKRQNYSGMVYALGERPRNLIENVGLNIVFCEAANTAEELIRSFDIAEFEGKRLLFIRGSRAKRTVPEMLSGVAEVDEVEVYRTVDIPVEEEVLANVRERLARGEIDWICFFSPSGVARFVSLISANNTKVAVIGRTTAATAREAGLNVKLVSPKAHAGEFAFSLIKRLDGNIE